MANRISSNLGNRLQPAPYRGDVGALMNTQSEAKRFFSTKVIDRARTEGVALSEAERRMLYWSESDPEFKADPKLVEQLASEMSDEDYEAKIATLLQNSFAADSAADSRAREVWQQARSVLKQGDHYILIMIDRAVGTKLKRWWEFWK
jgi:hypothetical protein